MQKLHELKEKLCDQLEEYSDKDLTAGSLDVVDKLAHTIKNLDKIIDKYEGNEYSNYGGSYDDMYGGSYRGMYNMGGSYARGRGRGAKRDSMGRYASDGGYSRHGDMMSDLRELMENAPDDRTRQIMQSAINQMNQ